MNWDACLENYPRYLWPRLRRGLGLGVGNFYKPWISTRFPSQGTAGAVKGIKTDRRHHYLSDLETTYFFLLERQPQVVDIREQFPILDLDGTLQLCADLGVRHGYRGRFPEPFTLDFLITEKVSDRQVYRAASVKTEDDAKDPEIQLRLAVELRWCELHGIPWTLVNTDRFTKGLLSTLRQLRGWYRHRLIPPEDAEAERAAQEFLALYQRQELLSSSTKRLARRLRVTEDRAGDLIRYCGWNDLIPVDVTREFARNAPVVLKS